MVRTLFEPRGPQLHDPPVARFLFSQTESAWIWIILRFWLGYQWIQAAWHKIDDPRWMTTGEALQGFWVRVITVPEQGRPPIHYGWYRDFIELLYNGGHHVWFAKLVVYGELLVGIALVLGVFVGFAATMGALMNLNFMLAGTASSNPVLFGVAALMVMGWKTAGWWGMDRWLLPLVGTPWQPGSLPSLMGHAVWRADGPVHRLFGWRLFRWHGLH